MPAASSMPTGGTFDEMAFSDEFEGAALDPMKWIVKNGHQDYWPDTPWRRNFKKENVYVENGALVIRTMKEKGGFSTRAVVTGSDGPTSLFEQAFGRYESRVRFPTQQGFSCAFWLWNSSEENVDGSGRDGTVVGLYAPVGPDSAKVEYSIDGSKWAVLDTARDSWYPSDYVRLNGFILSSSLSDSADVITFRTISDAGKVFRLYRLMVG